MAEQGENMEETEETTEEPTTLERFQEELDHFDEGAVAAFYENQEGYWDENPDEFADQFRDAYQGEWASNEDFARDVAEDIGAIRRDADWPHTCIDWERAARELMYDYFESGGYYFRNL